MDKTDVYIKLDQNLRSIDTIEGNISTLQYTLYKRNVDRIRQIKNKEIHDYFEKQAEFFNQRTDSFNDDLKSIYEEYDYQMKRMVDVYNKIFVDVLKIMKNASNNQKIAISNIITMDNQYNQDFLTPEKISDLKSIKLACAQKKVNYSVIIRECKLRINWCVQEVQKDLNQIFDNSSIRGKVGLNQLGVRVDKFGNKIDPREMKENTTETAILDEQKEPKGLFARIKKYINNLFSGRSNYQKVINEYKAQVLISIKTDVDKRVNDLAFTLAGVTKQLDNAKNKINSVYDNVAKNSSILGN